MRDISNPRRTSARRGRAWPLALVEVLTLLLAVSGCEPDTSATILVELRTDLVPGVDFDYFEFRSVRALRRPVFPSEYGRSWLTPTFMGELAAEEGSREYIARLSLRTETVVERRLLVQISGRTGVQLILDRACVGVTCEDQVPGCLAGQCVAAGCITGAEPDCALTAECDDDRPCPAPSACATAACEPGGWCFTDATTCPPDEYCDPTGGCLPIPMSIMDGGTGSARDGGMPGEARIADGASTFSFHTLEVPSSGLPPETDLVTGSGIDHGATQWFWYRGNADSRETRFPTPDATTFEGNVATLSWSDLGGAGLASAVATFTLTEQSPSSLSLAIDLEITNISAADLTFTAFEYTDLDVDEAVTNTVALNAETIAVGGSTSDADLRSPDADGYVVGQFDQLLAQLDDTAITVADNTGLPYEGDAAVVFARTFTLARDERATMSTSLTLSPR